MTCKPVHVERAAVRAFTLVEMLLVVAVLALLISILLPTLTQSKNAAITVICQSRLRQMQTACVSYSQDNAGWFPWRSSSGSYMPHIVSGSGFNLNVSFSPKYLGSQLDPLVFCPSTLYTVRSPTTFPSYPGTYYAYQYTNYPAGGWVVPKPKLQRRNADGAYAMWTCLTTLKDSGNYLAHDVPERPITPKGQNAAKIDGSVAWHPWSNLEVFAIVSSHQFSWPKR